MLKLLFTPWRLKWYSISVLFGLLLAISIALFSGEGPVILSGRLGGDFPAFYAAGRIVASKGFNVLYDYDEQMKWQMDLFPNHKSYLPFAYPPLVALAYAPISLLPYRIAYLVNVFVVISAFLIAFFCLKKIIPNWNEFFLPVFTLSLTFYPFLKSNLCGQNSAITLMLITLIWLFTKKSKHYLAGIFMGLLLYKPQFAIPLIGLFLLSGRYKVASTGIAFGFLIITIGLFFTGIEPYKHWYNFLFWFTKADAIVNGYNAVSWIGFFDNLFGTENIITLLVGAVCCFATVLLISYIWAVGKEKSDFNAQIGIAVTSIILIPPHMMFYDAGLILLTYSVIISKITKGKFEIIFFVWLTGMTQFFAVLLGFSPIFLLVVFTYFLSLIYLSTPAMGKRMLKSVTGKIIIPKTG